MLELLLYSAIKKSTAGVQTTRTVVNLPNLIRTRNISGHCLSMDKKSFYVCVGYNTYTGTLVKQLFKYTLATNTWVALAELPSSITVNDYWAIADLGDGRLYAVCRDVQLTYSISSNAWTIGKAVPTDCIMYGVKAHYYKGKVYRFGNKATGSVGLAVVYNPAIGETTLLNQISDSMGAYNPTVLIDDRIFSFPPTSNLSRTRIISFNISNNSIDLGTIEAFGYGFGTPCHNVGGLVYLIGTDGLKCYAYDVINKTRVELPDRKATRLNSMSYMDEDGIINLWGGNASAPDYEVDTVFTTYST